ncbi:flavin reductase family protein [Embleya sp. NPDC005575]|uniref:flavin reductase family protein n=1 Tax=Embleya sp. NPDC005575 TaxID=3156892 RepID=UPI0033B9BB29
MVDNSRSGRTEPAGPGPRTDSDSGLDPGDRADFDAFVAALDYPMFIVTAARPDTGERSGCLVGFATQCSIEPPRFLVCVSTLNHTHGVATAAPVLAVHAPDSRQHPLAALFGEETGDRMDKFAHCAWTEGPAGVPLLTDCPRRFVGRVVDAVDLGDHTAIVLAPIEVPEHSDPTRTDLLTYADVQDLAPGHPER